jgi:hypothetical protein
MIKGTPSKEIDSESFRGGPFVASLTATDQRDYNPKKRREQRNAKNTGVLRKGFRDNPRDFGSRFRG